MSTPPQSGRRRRTSKGMPRVGGLDDLAGSLTQKDGFATLQDMFNWPETAFDLCFASSAPSLLSSPVEFVAGRNWKHLSCYAGKGTDATVLQYLNRILKSRGHADHDAFSFVQASE
eukprot:682698-Pyramimonas_sp.AAC.1